MFTVKGVPGSNEISATEVHLMLGLMKEKATADIKEMKEMKEIKEVNCSALMFHSATAFEPPKPLGTCIAAAVAAVAVAPPSSSSLLPPLPPPTASNERQRTV